MYGTPSKNFPVQSRAARNETGSGMRSASPGTLAKRSASQSSAALGQPQHITESVMCGDVAPCYAPAINSRNTNGRMPPCL